MANENECKDSSEGATFRNDVFNSITVSCRRVAVNFSSIGLEAITIPLHGGVKLNLSVELESGGLEYEVS